MLSVQKKERHGDEKNSHTEMVVHLTTISLDDLDETSERWFCRKVYRVFFFFLYGSMPVFGLFFMFCCCTSFFFLFNPSSQKLLTIGLFVILDLDLSA